MRVEQQQSLKNIIAVSFNKGRRNEKEEGSCILEEECASMEPTCGKIMQKQET